MQTSRAQAPHTQAPQTQAPHTQAPSTQAAHADVADLTPVLSTSAVPPAVTQLRGRVAHDAAVRRLLDSYRTLPAGTPVRLRKRTSNLFRTRARAAAAGLDVTGLDGVVSIDVAARTADVQGMCTYETLVAATLPRGLMPAVVPQLRTITLGGAVTGLGVESTSFRDGLPHESVLELDVLTGDGRLVTATPGNEHADLYAGFPNSYGTLGYAVRLRIALRPVEPYVLLRNARFDDLDALQAAIGRVCDTREWDGEPVDFCDGVVFSPAESYLVLGRWAREVPDASDYTGRDVYYRSLRDRGFDALRVHDYLWRWDADWFWCSAALGAQHPVVRRVWPARLRRSDVYARIIGFEARHRLWARVEKARGLPERERVIQDVEVPLERTADFLRWFGENVPMSPVWLCPIRLSPPAELASHGQPWPLYPLRSGQTYVNIGFWGTVPIAPGRADGDVNRQVEAAVDVHGGSKSLYSDAYYDAADFWSRYGGAAYSTLKQRYDPEGRLLDLYEKAVGRR